MGHIIAMIVFGLIFFVGYQSMKYEGKTAQEWHNQYSRSEENYQKESEELSKLKEDLKMEIALKQCIDFTKEPKEDFFDDFCRQAFQNGVFNYDECSSFFKWRVNSFSDFKKEDCIEVYRAVK